MPNFKAQPESETTSRGTQYGANEPQRPFYHLNPIQELDCLTHERPYTGHLKQVVNTQSEQNCLFN